MHTTYTFNSFQNSTHLYKLLQLCVWKEKRRKEFVIDITGIRREISTDVPVDKSNVLNHQTADLSLVGCLTTMTIRSFWSFFLLVL